MAQRAEARVDRAVVEIEVGLVDLEDAEDQRQSAGRRIAQAEVRLVGAGRGRRLAAVAGGGRCELRILQPLLVTAVDRQCARHVRGEARARQPRRGRVRLGGAARILDRAPVTRAQKPERVGACLRPALLVGEPAVELTGRVAADGARRIGREHGRRRCVQSARS